MHTHATDFALALVGAVICVLIASSVIYGWPGMLSPSLFEPLSYSGDFIGLDYLIKRTLEAGIYFYNSRTSYPFGSALQDFPISDFGNIYLIALFSAISGSRAAGMQLFFLFGFALTFISAYLASRWFKLSCITAFGVGILYALMPFHFLRIGHLLYTMYWMAPIFFCLGYRLFCYSDENLSRWDVVGLISLVLLPAFGLYYACFGLIILALAALMNFVANRNPKIALQAGAILAPVILGLALTLAPFILYRLQAGTNPMMGSRNPADSELFGLKLVQMLIPSVAHRFEPFRQFSEFYRANFPVVTENFTASFGFVGAFGILLLLSQATLGSLLKILDRRKLYLAAITLALLLFTTVGGLSTIFALFVTPQIRSWNRISSFLHYPALLITFIIIEDIVGRLRIHPKSWLLMMISIAVVLFGIWDQTPSPCNGDCRSDLRNSYESDRAFVAHLESALPTGAAIYQLPYISYPEAPPIAKLDDSRLAVGYLESTHLRWSWGGVRGREGSLFYAMLSERPLDLQIEAIKRLGFSGIYIDRRGFEDNGAAIEKSLNWNLGVTGKIESDDKTLLFFPIPNADPLLPDWSTTSEVMLRLDGLLDTPTTSAAAP